MKKNKVCPRKKICNDICYGENPCEFSLAFDKLLNRINKLEKEINKKETCEIKLYTIETAAGIESVAEIPELKGCVGSGDSYEEALKDALENKDVYFDVLKERK